MISAARCGVEQFNFTFCKEWNHFFALFDIFILLTFKICLITLFSFSFYCFALSLFQLQNHSSMISTLNDDPSYLYIQCIFNWKKNVFLPTIFSLPAPSWTSWYDNDRMNNPYSDPTTTRQPTPSTSRSTAPASITRAAAAGSSATTAPSRIPRKAGCWCTPVGWPTTTKDSLLREEPVISWFLSLTLKLHLEAH